MAKYVVVWYINDEVFKQRGLTQVQAEAKYNALTIQANCQYVLLFNAGNKIRDHGTIDPFREKAMASAIDPLGFDEQ